MADRVLDIPAEQEKEARYEKQCICIMHGKRCAECDGVDVNGSECRYFEGGRIICKG